MSMVESSRLVLIAMNYFRSSGESIFKANFSFI